MRSNLSEPQLRSHGLVALLAFLFMYHILIFLLYTQPGNRNLISGLQKITAGEKENNEHVMFSAMIERVEQAEAVEKEKQIFADLARRPQQATENVPLVPWRQIRPSENCSSDICLSSTASAAAPCTNRERGNLTLTESTSSTIVQQSQRTTSSSSQKETEQKKSVLVLHLGPPKMGTTTLQCAIGRFYNQDLRKDNFVNIGESPGDCGGMRAVAGTAAAEGKRFMLPHHFLYEQLIDSDEEVAQDQPQAQTNNTEETNPKPEKEQPRNTKLRVHQDFVDTLSGIHAQGKNAILVTELFEGFPGVYFPPSMLSFSAPERSLEVWRRLTLHWTPHDQFSAIAEAIKSNWTVHVVLGYRPLYDYMPSRWSQTFKPKPSNEWAFLWPGQQGNLTVLGNKKIFVTGQHTPPFGLDNRGIWTREYWSKWENDQTHLTLQMMEAVKTIPCWTVSIINMNQLPDTSGHHIPTPGSPSGAVTVDPLLDFFFCNILEGWTPSVCRKVRTGTVRMQLFNPAYPMNCDILATAAYSAGLIHGKVLKDAEGYQQVVSFPQRQWVVRKILERQEHVLGKTDQDFPLTCLPESDLLRIEQTSINAEAKIFPELATPLAQDQHRKAFRSAAHKLCSINTTAVLTDKGWRDFFASL